MDLLNFLNKFAGLVGPLGFIIAAVFGTLYGKKKAEKYKDNDTISTYRENLESKVKLLETREQELAESKHAREQDNQNAKIRHDENQKRIDLLEQKANILENQVTQAPSIAKMAENQALQHQQLLNALGKMTQELGTIAKNMAKNPVTVIADGREK